MSSRIKECLAKVTEYEQKAEAIGVSADLRAYYLALTENWRCLAIIAKTQTQKELVS